MSPSAIGRKTALEGECALVGECDFDSFFLASLREAPAYSLSKVAAEFKLDQNELAYDWPLEWKRMVSERLMARAWNGYPDPFHERLQQALCRHLNIAPDRLLVGPGSNYLISLIISAFSRSGARIVYADPSFPLYGLHCRYEGIRAQAWQLSQDLVYDADVLRKILGVGPTTRGAKTPGDVVVFASPNNPVGNELAKADLQALLQDYPNTIFVADEAYLEFSDQDFLDLVKKYPNLVLLRTFAKGWGSAGVRVGYAVMHMQIQRNLHKLRLPFLVNIFAEEAAIFLLEEPSCRDVLSRHHREVRSEREWIYSELRSKDRSWHCYPSAANFFLIRFATKDSAEACQRALLERAGVLARPVGKSGLLASCLRLSIGTPQANKRWVDVLQSIA
jgi:histidinol-phosphate aminotransferase